MEMPAWLDMLGRLTDRSGGFFRRLGDLESNIYRDILEDIAIDRPIHVAGLARSGSTVLLEMMASHPDTGTHRYRDFPGQFLITIPWHYPTHHHQCLDSPGSNPHR